MTLPAPPEGPGLSVLSLIPHEQVSKALEQAPGAGEAAQTPRRRHRARLRPAPEATARPNSVAPAPADPAAPTTPPEAPALPAGLGPDVDQVHRAASSTTRRPSITGEVENHL